MKRRTRYFIELLFLRGITNDVRIVEVPEKPIPNEVEFPDYSYAFRLFTKVELEDEDGTIYKSDPNYYGKTFWHPNSFVTDYERASQMPERGLCLLDNMKRNGWEEMIWTRYRCFPQPYNPEIDVILKPKDGEKF